MLALPTTTPFAVRRAEPSDLPALAATRRASWWATYRGVVPEAELRSMDDRRTVGRMAQAQRSSLQRLLVVEDRPGTPLGYAWTGPHREGHAGHRGEIYELYLHPLALGRGAGRQLLTSAIWGLVEQGLHPVWVWVLAANPARHFYAACGGAPMGQGRVTVGGRTLTRLAFGWGTVLPLPLGPR
ncbi:MAG: GNAT family N-acetyltransferase [Deltaproteobacteria bacterium]|nr:GNAT family N-acetyltransferase [Deltaproteobacteria bacterium]